MSFLQFPPPQLRLSLPPRDSRLLPHHFCYVIPRTLNYRLLQRHFRYVTQSPTGITEISLSRTTVAPAAILCPLFSIPSVSGFSQTTIYFLFILTTWPDDGQFTEKSCQDEIKINIYGCVWLKPETILFSFRTGTRCTGDWVGPRDGVDGCGRFRSTGIRPPDHPVHSEALYRVRFDILQIPSGFTHCLRAWSAVSLTPSDHCERPVTTS